MACGNSAYHEAVRSPRWFLPRACQHYLIVQVRLTEAASGVEVWSNSAENRSNDDGQAVRNKVLRQTIQDALSNYPPAP